MNDSLPPVEALYPLFFSGLRASVYLAGAALLTLVIGWLFRRFQRFTAHLVSSRGGVEIAEFEKQTTTLVTTARRVVVTLVWIFALILALKELRFDVAPLLAGAGVVGIAVGFAAQSILKDLLNGLFLLAEGHIRINDVVRINDISGTVEELTLRITVLRGMDGAVHVFANGSIDRFSNLTLVFSCHVIDIAIDLDADAQLALDVMSETGKDLQSDPVFGPLILEPLESYGIDRFTEQGQVLKGRIKTIPNQQWKVGREFNRRFKLALAKRGMGIATAQRQITVPRSK